MREKLKYHCTVISGYAFKSSDFQSEEAVPVVKIGNISNGRNVIIDDETQFVNSSFLSLDNKYHINKGDILISLTGSHMNQPNSMVGRVCRSYDECVYLLNQRAGKVICHTGTDPDYVYYLLSTKAMKENIANRAYGAANQVNVSPTDIMSIKWAFHCYKEQKRISSILSAYDKLIEVNNKQIRVLEQMVENLYKEWFVRFRFPGHEKADFENGISKSWRYCRFAEVFNCVRGVSYSSDEIDCPAGHNLINLKNIQGYGGFKRNGTKKYNGQYKQEQVVKQGDLIMGVTDMTQDRRTVGAVALIPRLQGVISADLVKLESPLNNVFSYCMFRWGNYSSYLSQFGNGANVIHLKPSTLGGIKILIPNEDLIDSFSQKVGLAISQIDILNEQNDNLSKQRDLLLPRLMGGKMEV